MLSRESLPQCKPTPESATRCCALDLEGRPVGPSPPPSGRGPDCGRKKKRAPTPHLRRLLHKAHLASPRGVAHGHGYLLVPEGLRPLPEKPDRGLNNTRTRTGVGSEILCYRLCCVPLKSV